MSETNNLNQPGNSDSDTQSGSNTEMNNHANSAENTVVNSANLAAENGDTSANLSPPVLEQKNNSPETQKTQNIDWHKLAHKLREHNRKLLKKVFHLEQEVAETNNRINEHKVRSQSTDMLIAQQAEEINHNQEEIAHLIQELETSQQEVHTQNVLVESLSKQLEKANENFAQLERDCALLQEKDNQQTHNLLIKTQQLQELSARLNRQQRYTLQYKAALDNYLDVASSGHVAETKVDGDLLHTHPQPIQAWSQLQANQETSTIKSSNLGIHLEPELQPTTKNHKENWPSPIITSVDNDKKPKSLAAVELPTFQHSDIENS